ncbi:GNAT family N-acetyltransferase [Corynebacterium amycolatum]|uniref:GNAT family N-acetyltransferase n=1 Tax=Corynebacterium amycolatum TaxID=43765 RepID=UPI00211A4E4A|nr:GNAT family N-acetyltransferase [Corynebacterium amycolatum]MCQ9124960.1 GNAT family N-acetyltransferase [Corynebacterium amycolatum]MCQ9168802.1 GNAT family N-acetyltransferase [Corynebacterium amycolatum]MCQ9176561.1 GNAT family N-acetyltransferase [Corynebacterium amycolatum]
MIERAFFSDLSATDAYAISALRTDVFYLEQSCTEPEMDWRDLEDTAEHYFIRDDNDARKIIAYLRVIDTLDEFSTNYPRTIGRVVVDAASRGRGLSSKLLQQVIADHPDTGLILHAQTQAKAVYAKAGFHEIGETFMEAGIEHITMVRDAARGEA